jgi:probable HAF family extracellular repeat protein
MHAVLEALVAVARRLRDSGTARLSPNGMRRLWLPSGIAATLALIGIMAGSAGGSATAISVVDLGTLPGGTYSSAWAINNLGQAAGMSNDDTLAGNKQVIWIAGAISRIDACCGAGQATPKAINDAREVVGWENAGYATNGIYWDAGGTAYLLPALPGGENRVQAYDINNSGLIVGHSRDATGFVRHAVMWDRTAFLRDLGFMGSADPGLANYSNAKGINDAGDVVGDGVVGSDGHAFIWRDGSFTDLGLGVALDINNNGLVMGWTSGRVPVVWRNRIMENLPGLSGAAVAYGHVVTDLNNNGDIVGYAPATASPYQDTAVLWRGGKAIDLGRYPGGAVSRAYGINDSGQIVGEGSIIPGGPMHALMWTVPSAPTPNTAPVVSLVATTSTNIRAGGSVSFAGSFADPDAGPWTYTFNWGNGTTTGTVSGPGTVNATRTYPATGRYRATLTVTDGRGASGKSGSIDVRVR